MFTRFVEYGLILNTKKIKLFIVEGIFLGFLISKDRIRVDPIKVVAIRDRLELIISIEVRGFVNVARYLRSLIDRYAIATLCDGLTRRGMHSAIAKYYVFLRYGTKGLLSSREALSLFLCQ